MTPEIKYEIEQYRKGIRNIHDNLLFDSDAIQDAIKNSVSELHFLESLAYLELAAIKLEICKRG